MLVYADIAFSFKIIKYELKELKIYCNIRIDYTKILTHTKYF